jgi:hypothetical protein
LHLSFCPRKREREIIAADTAEPITFHWRVIVPPMIFASVSSLPLIPIAVRFYSVGPDLGPSQPAGIDQGRALLKAKALGDWYEAAFCSVLGLSNLLIL